MVSTVCFLESVMVLIFTRKSYIFFFILFLDKEICWGEKVLLSRFEIASFSYPKALVNIKNWFAEKWFLSKRIFLIITTVFTRASPYEELVISKRLNNTFYLGKSFVAFL